MKKRDRFIVLIGIVVVLVATAGCVAPQQKKPIVWNRDSNEAIVAFQKPFLPENNLDYSRAELERGLMFFEGGNFDHSDARFRNATRVMSRIVEKTSQDTTATVWDERAKTFKGEPYERATAFFYRGVCRFNTGDYSGALAAFRSSLASDEETRNSKVKYLQDFTISQFMAALCYKRLGEPQNAEEVLELARSNCPTSNPFLTAASLTNNFIAVIGIGYGPFKVDARSYQTGLSPEHDVDLIIDDGPPGKPSEATDLLFQAKSQQWGKADTARVEREIGKAILSGVLSGLTGVNVNIQDYSDLRSWIGLPLKYYIYTANVPPGLHKITLKVYDKKGNELERNRQVWFDVPVTASADSVLCLRDGRNWQSEYGVQQVKLNPPAQVSTK